MNTDEIKKKLLKKKIPEVISSKDLLSSGSTLLNLACSGRSVGAFLKGYYILFVGDSNSGKTFLCLTCLAEAAKNKEFDGYRFIYDSPEYGALMNMQRFFGSAMTKRLELPGEDCSATIEEFYFHVDDAIGLNKPFIYILDSMDSLSSIDEEELLVENKKAFRKGKDMKGSYGDGKGRKNSSGIRQLLTPLRKLKSILIIISQTRDNIGFGSQYNPKTRSGGRALRFYAAIEMWSSIRGRIKRPVKGKERQLGITSQVEIIRSRLTGKQRTVEIPIYHSSGIDDLGSCVNYLIDEKYWSKNKFGMIDAKDFKVNLRLEDLIAHIEEKGLEEELRAIVSDLWKEIEAACSVKRKKKYL